MERKEIGNPLDRENRNNHNHNFQELYSVVGDFVGSVTDEVLDKIMESVQIRWLEPVQSYEDLPENAKKGDTRMILDEVEGKNHVYRYDGKDWIKIQELDAETLEGIEEMLSERLDVLAKEINNLQYENENIFSLNDVNNLYSKFDSETGERVIKKGDKAKSFYFPVKEGEIYSFSRNEITNDKFSVVFCVEEPKDGSEWISMESYDDEFQIKGVKVPEGINYILLRLINLEGELPSKIKVERGTRVTYWTPAKSSGIVVSDKEPKDYDVWFEVL